MPLLVSPIDGTTPMQQIKRDGIEIDRCPLSGGVWLDRGELEKLMAAIQNAAAEDRAHYIEYQHARASVPAHNAPPQAYPAPSGYHPRFDDDDYEDFHRKKYGQKSKIKKLFDLFD